MHAIRLLLAFLFATACATVVAQTYPSKPVRMIVPYAAGGTTDILARILSEKLGQALGQPVVVEYKPGAGGTIGTDATAKSPPDGYTISMGAPGTHATATSLYAKLPYDPIRDFVPLIHVANVPNVVVVNPNVPANSIVELIALAKQKPGGLAFGSAGVGATTHLTGELFNLMTGTQITHIPYKGSGQALIDLLGGQIPIMFENLPGAAQHIRNGKLRALAVTSAKRATAFADVPTVAEAGVPGFDVVSWFGLFAPAATPAPVTQRLNFELDRILKAADVRERIVALGADTVGGSGPEFGRFVADEIAKWSKVIRQAGIKVE